MSPISKNDGMDPVQPLQPPPSDECPSLEKKKYQARIPLELNGSNVSPFDSPVTNPVRVQLLRISAAVMRNQRECRWPRLRQRSVTRLSSATRSLTGNNPAATTEGGVAGGRPRKKSIVPRGQRFRPPQTCFGLTRPPSGPPPPPSPSDHHDEISIQ